MGIYIDLDVEMAKRKIKLSELAEKVGISIQNLSVLKSGRAKAIRFTTLDRICSVLGCQPGDILKHSESKRAVAFPKSRKKMPAIIEDSSEETQEPGALPLFANY